MFRTRAINYLITNKGYESYLEIGLSWPHYNFTKVNCAYKESCDPYFSSENDMKDIDRNNLPVEIKKYLTYLKTSDEMFADMPEDKKFDIIFIDGLHTEEQCCRDIVNSMAHLNPGGVILVHDTYPPSEESQKTVSEGDIWVGEVWKSVAKLNRTNLSFHTIKEDTGLSIIEYNPNPDFSNFMEASNYEFKDFSEDIIHFISNEEFYDLYKSTKVIKKGTPINLVVYVDAKNENFSEELKLHFKCIEYYKYLFTNVLFVIGVTKKTSLSSVDRIREKIYEVGLNCNISIKVAEKDEYGSGTVFYNEIAKKLPESDGITAFVSCEDILNGHDSAERKKSVIKQIISSYFQMFDNIEYVTGVLINGFKGICFGSFLFASTFIKTKNNWYYYGGFQWIHNRKLYEYMTTNNVFLPPLNSKTYAETFLGNILPYDYKIVGSINETYIISEPIVMYKNSDEVTCLYYKKDVYLYDCFYEDICNSLCIPIND